MTVKRQSRAASFAAVEQALRAALNGEIEVIEPPAPPAPITRRHKSPPHVTRALHCHKTTVRYNVRHHWGGHSFVVEYSKATISEFEVKTMAEADIASKQYIDVVHIETIRV